MFAGKCSVDDLLVAKKRQEAQPALQPVAVRHRAEERAAGPQHPHDLADEAFLRRIQTKVMVESVTAEVFDQIFHRAMHNAEAPYEAGAAQYLRERCLAAGTKFLRACYPMDVYKLVKAISEYEGRPVRMSKANIDRAVALYFAREKRPAE